MRHHFIKPLKGLKLTLANSPKLHDLNGRLEQELEAFKPYVYIFRQDSDTTGKEKNLIKDIRFKLVIDLSVIQEREKEKSKFNLSDYEYLYLPEIKTIYIKTPPYIDDEKKLKEDISFCSTIAEAFSALIDVDAQRQQIRELFSKSKSSRDDIIRAELDDINLEKLILAKEKLGIVNDPKIQFWTSFIKCFPPKKIPKENFTDELLLIELNKLFPDYSEIILKSFDNINYENYNEESSVRLIIELLNKSQLSLLNFNKYAYPSIDISESYNLDFKRVKEREKKAFKQVLYSTFIDSNKDKKDFLNSLSQYDSLNGNFQNDTNYDVEADLRLQLFEQFKINLSEEYDFNFEKIYSSNRNIYGTKADEQNISSELAYQFINVSLEIESLLYFETEIEKLIENLKDWIPKANEGDYGRKELAKKRIKIGNLDFSFNNFNDLFLQLESDKTLHATLLKIKIKNIENENYLLNGNKSNSVKNPMPPKQSTEDLGFLGECLVYKHLLHIIKNKESVKWVSEYAKLAGVNADGKNGWGYDLEYIPNDAKFPKYVEVKVVGQENAFHISSNEILQGEKLKKHYEIFLVRNIGETDKISIEIIQGPFDYKGKNTFNDNDLFTVINDNYILKFQKIKLV